jgi:CRISPR type I-E-associated protein CasB/Cse2
MSQDKFMNYLYALKHEDNGTLAAYRRACGQRLGESRGCQEFAAISTRSADFLTVTLAAQYQSDKIKNDKRWPFKSQGNIGAAWAIYCRSRKKEDDPHTFYKKRQEDLAAGRPPANIPSVHERFRTILDAELECDGTGEFAHRLRGLVRMLVAEDIPIDVIQLACDLRGWRAESRYVQERWAKAFYSPPVSARGGEQSSSEEDEPEEPESQDEGEEDVD